MTAAIREIADKKDEYTAKPDIIMAEYLQACNFIFKRGILLHNHIVFSFSGSPCLSDMSEGIKL